MNDKTKRILNYALLGAVLVLALALRLREPLHSPVIGAEDPYLHMSRSWDVVQGEGLRGDYPPGTAILLAPFAFMGAEVLYNVVRWMPPLLGVIQAVGVYMLARYGLKSEIGGIAAAFVVAVVPENIFRTNIFIPTAIDLAILPFFFLGVLKSVHGDTRAMKWTTALAVVLALTHPWGLAIAVPAVVVFALVHFKRTGDKDSATKVLKAAGALVALFVFAMYAVPGAWNPAAGKMDHAMDKFVEVLTNPNSLMTLPPYVNLVNMVTIPVMLLAGLGAVMVLAKPDDYGVVSLMFSATTLPFVLVDWFDVWFLPHRTVAYLTLAFAMLIAIPAARTAETALAATQSSESKKAADTGGATPVVPVAVVGVVLLAALPSGAATQLWYRTYDTNDFQAFEEIAGMGASLVVGGSWQAAEGYQAITGSDAKYKPGFFTNDAQRNFELRQNPDLIVIVDNYTHEIGTPTGFLEGGGWTIVGQWDDITAYRKG